MRLHDAGLDRFYHLRGDRSAPASSLASHDLLWLAPLEASLANATHATAIPLDVQGLHCAGCVWLIDELFHRQEGGLDVIVNPALGRCDLRVRRGFDLRAFVSSVESFGYVFGARSAARRADDTSLVARTGIAVALAMNAMTFALAQYLGLREEPMVGVVRALEVGLSFATIAVGAPVFFRAAWAGLRARVLHLDVPIALGIALGGVGTLLGYLETGDASYADTMAVFVALMLVGRLVEQRAVSRNRHRLLDSPGSAGLLVRRLAGARSEIVPAASVVVDDRLRVARGEVVPVRGKALRKGRVSLDWISGESTPVAVHAGDDVVAGAIVLGPEPLDLVALGTIEEGGLVALLDAEEQSDAGRERGFLHRVISFYVVAVLAAASLVFAWTLVHAGLAEALSRTTAVLVVTCPCGVGIASPLAIDLVVRALRRRGVLVRHRSALARLADIEGVAFDKTGTLTVGLPRLVGPDVASLSAIDRMVLASLTRDNAHPKSRAVHALVSAEAPLSLEVSELPGKGVEASFSGHGYRLGSASFARGGRDGDEAADLVFAVDGEVLARWRSEECLRDDAAAELVALGARGLALAMLSGDATARVDAVARRLAIDPRRALGALDPDAKAAWLRADGRRWLFVGDGANDTRAVDAAHVGATPSVDRPFLAAKTDLVFCDHGIASVRWAIDAARALRGVMRRNLGLAILYNVFAVSLAAAGACPPWAAAILMPLSSLVLVGTTVRSLEGEPWMSSI